MKLANILAVVVACLCALVGVLWHDVTVHHGQSQKQLCILDKTLVGILIPGRDKPAILADINAIIAQAPCPITIPPKE